jgi:hypothetical protein
MLQQPQAPTASFESIAAEIAQADSAIKQWTERKDYLRGLLVQLHQAGEAPSKFTAAGKTWSLTQGKKTWTYPAPIQEYEAALKKAKTISQNDGSATYELSEPFYTAREVKSVEAGK